MKKIALLLAVLLILAAFCGCRSHEINPGDASTEDPAVAREETAEPSSEPSAEPSSEPSSEPSAEPSSEPSAELPYLGKQVEFDPSESTDDIAAHLNEDGKICQIVYHFSFADMALTPEKVYAYDSFPAITGEEPSEGASRDDGSSLYVDITPSNDPPPEHVTKLITDPVIVGAFDDMLSGLEFTEEVPEEFAGNPYDFLFSHENACYYDVDADGNKTVYVFYSEGELVGRGTEQAVTAVSTNPIPDALRSYFFAVMNLYFGADEALDIGFDESSDSSYIEAELGDKTVQLRGKEALDFIRLFTNYPEYVYPRFHCKTLINCEREDHGKAVLTFKRGDDNPEVSVNKDVYTLYEDGVLEFVTILPYRWSLLIHDMTVYGVVMQRQIVSVDSFDTQAAIDYLNDHAN